MEVGDIVLCGAIIGVVCHSTESTVTCACHDMQDREFDIKDCTLCDTYSNFLKAMERSIRDACK